MHDNPSIITLHSLLLQNCVLGDCHIVSCLIDVTENHHLDDAQATVVSLFVVFLYIVGALYLKRLLICWKLWELVAVSYLMRTKFLCFLVYYIVLMWFVLWQCTWITISSAPHNRKQYLYFCSISNSFGDFFKILFLFFLVLWKLFWNFVSIAVGFYVSCDALEIIMPHCYIICCIIWTTTLAI